MPSKTVAPSVAALPIPMWVGDTQRALDKVRRSPCACTHRCLRLADGCVEYLLYFGRQLLINLHINIAVSSRQGLSRQCVKAATEGAYEGLPLRFVVELGGHGEQRKKAQPGAHVPQTLPLHGPTELCL